MKHFLLIIVLIGLLSFNFSWAQTEGSFSSAGGGFFGFFSKIFKSIGIFFGFGGSKELPQPISSPTVSPPLSSMPPSKTPAVISPSPSYSPTATPKKQTPAPTATPVSVLKQTALPAPTLSPSPTPLATPKTETTVSPTSLVATPEPAPVKVSDIPNLATYWSFDEGSGETLYDSSPNSITGKIINVNKTSAWLDRGVAGRALELDGYDDYVIIEDLSEIDFGQPEQNYSISLWVKRNGHPAAVSGLISKNDGYGKYPFAVKILKNGLAALDLSDGVRSSEIVSRESVTDNQWRHLAAVRDAENRQLRLYLDGQEAADPVGDETSGSLANDDQIWIGKYFLDANSYFHDAFAIDEVRLYGHALSENEIKALFDLNRDGFSLFKIKNFLYSLINYFWR